MFPLRFELSPIISKVTIKKEINVHIQTNDIYCTWKIISIVNLGRERYFSCITYD